MPPDHDLGPVLEAMGRVTGAGLALMDRDGRLLSAEPRYLELIGRSATEAIGRDVFVLTLPEAARAAARAAHGALLSGQLPSETGPRTLVGGDGRRRLVAARAVRLVLPDGTPCRLDCLTAGEPSAAHRRLLGAVAGIALFTIDPDGGWVDCDPAFRALAGLPPGEAPLPVARLTEAVVAGDRPTLGRLLAGDDDKGTVRVRQPDGSVRTIDLAFTAAGENAGDRRRAGIAMAADRIDRENGASTAERHAERLAAGPDAPREPLLVATYDIDRLARINERVGARGGDAVIAELGRRIAAASGGFVARTGTDRYTLFVTVADAAAGERLAAAVKAAAEAPYGVGGLALSVSVSCGYVIVEPGAGPAAIRGAADAARVALRDEDTQAGGRPVRYHARVGEAAARRRRLAERLPGAVARGEIEVVYQPQVTIETGRLAGLEALARWRLGEGETVPPDRFIPLAEGDGTIVSIGDFVATRMTEDAARWAGRGLAVPKLAVNVSPLQIIDHRFPAFLDRLAGRARALGLRVDLEMTESAYVAPTARNRERLAAIREHGMGLAIDDFGKGYSSLAYLENFPVDTIKIDRHFVARLDTSPLARTIVASVNQMAAVIGATVIAEGIATAAEARAARACGCRHGQGFFFSPPLTAAAVATLLAGDTRLPAGTGA